MRKGMTIGVVMITVLLLAAPSAGIAGWDISISIPLPGFSYYPAPAPYAYAPPAPLPDGGPVFYGGAWYRSSGPQWYISAYSGGPWYVVGLEYVPLAVINVPLVRGGGGSGYSGGVLIQPRGWPGWGHGGHRGGHGRGHGHDD
jgi:hypothetical protein